MHNCKVTNDQAAGLRQLMMPATEKLVTVALATPDLKIDKSIRLLRAHLDQTQYDRFVEFMPLHYSNIKTKLPPLGKVIICLTNTAASIKQAYSLIKVFSEHTFGQSIGVFVVASCASQAKTIFYNLSSVSSKHIGITTDLIGFDVPETQKYTGNEAQRLAMV
jgi:hypothetical protein